MILAAWSSKSAKWTAMLYSQTDGGYRLSERKDGSEVGAAHRPRDWFINDADALQYFDKYVCNAFDVEMKRVEP